MYPEDLYKKALKKWGAELQIKVAIEECSELIKELAKFGRVVNGSTIEKISEEIADVEIMLEQLKFMFVCRGKVEDYKVAKMEKIAKWLEETIVEITPLGREVVRLGKTDT